MSRSSARRGQADPLLAVLGVTVVVAAVSLYAAALVGADVAPDPDRASPTLRRVHTAASVAGVVDPGALPDARGVGPSAYRVGIRLSAGGRRWVLGPDPPPRADVASRPVSVRLGPGTVAVGRLRVAVWR